MVMNEEMNEMNEGRGPSCSVIRLAVLRPNDALSRIGTERALLAICCRRTVRNSSNPPWRKRETAEEQPSSAASFVRQGGAGPLGRCATASRSRVLLQASAVCCACSLVRAGDQ